MSSATAARQQGAAKARVLHVAYALGRREQCRELRDQGLTMQQVAARMRVSYRTIQRHERQLQEGGWCPPESESRAGQLRPLILAHLARFPSSTFSGYQLARVADPLNRPRTVDELLQRLAAEGLVEEMIGHHDPGIDRRPARRYRLAVARERAS